MRRSFVVALVGVLGAGGGCSRPNPGFEVAVLTSTTGSLDDSSSGAPTTALPPMTTTGETTSAVTVTTGDESTSTSSSTSSSSSGDGSSSESSTGEVPWPVDCLEEDWVTTRAGHAAADTWFLNFYAEGDQCLGMPGGECLEQSLGAVPTFPVFYGGDGDPIVDFLGVYALRFEELTPVHDGLPVPPEAFLGAVVTLRLARVTGNDDGWPLTNFDVYRMAPTAMPWSEGDNEVMKTCGLGEASYSCKSCGENMQEPWTCNEPWPESMFPFVKNDMNKVLTVEFAKTMKTEEDLALPFKGPIADWDWLLGSGMLLAPQELAETEIEVRAREYADEMARPFISVVHCPFKEG